MPNEYLVRMKSDLVDRRNSVRESLTQINDLVSSVSRHLDVIDYLVEQIRKEEETF